MMLPNPPSNDDETDDVDPIVGVSERGDRSHACRMYIIPAPREAGGTSGGTLCNRRNRYAGLSARQVEDGSTRVSAGVEDWHEDAKWRFKLIAASATSRQVVEFSVRAGGNFYANSRVTFTGVENPRLRLVAANDDRGRCFVGLNPPDTR